MEYAGLPGKGFEGKNIEHPTFNIEHRMGAQAVITLYSAELLALMILSFVLGCAGFYLFAHWLVNMERREIEDVLERSRNAHWSERKIEQEHTERTEKVLNHGNPDYQPTKI